ncbi:MAG: UDP-N-acetylmuramoyl-tripeptide--D-alanyl-D-alanine ligase [Gammaproteobacteria bacterium]|nr:MAG: UDP-N-acetylmuramoyl-tripeptide--D-alanyl-D-alanine ligase [Gammaproteobacteria bacterium]
MEMIKLSTELIAELTDGKLYGQDCCVEGVSIDTRTLRHGELFVALNGDRHDGHDYIDDAFKKGACAVMVQKSIQSNLPWILVKNCREALGILAEFCRNQFPGIVFGITGSNGKTTVKELLKSILSGKGRVLATHGNQNNDIGVPLTILGLLHSPFDYLVVEMGSNHPGEIDYLARIVRPDIAVVTSIGQAHLSGFGDVQGVIREKLSIFDHLNTKGKYSYGVIREDCGSYPYMSERLKDLDIRTFGVGPHAQIKVVDHKKHEDESKEKTNLYIKSKGELLKVRTRMLGEHNRINIAAAIAALSGVDIEREKILEGIERCHGAAGRLQLKELRSGKRIIDDTYNANPTSVRVAIDVLADLDGEKNLVLGEMQELGSDPYDKYFELGHYARMKGIHRVLVCGHEAKPLIDGFGKKGCFFPDQESLIAFLKEDIKTESGVRNYLVKGSRAAAMENVLESIMNGEANAAGSC